MLTPSESSAFARLCTEMKPCVRPHVSGRHPLPWLPPGVSLALCPAWGPAALQHFLDLLSHLEVPGLRQRSSLTEATETKSIFSFRKKTPQIARVYFPLPWGQELSRAAAQAQTALHVPLGLWGCSYQVHGVLPAPQQDEESFLGCPEESPQLCRAPRPSLQLLGSVGTLSVSGNDVRVEKQPGASGTGLALIELWWQGQLLDLEGCCHLLRLASWQSHCCWDLILSVASPGTRIAGGRIWS